MVFPLEHILIRFNGHFGGSSSTLDKWSTGLRFGFPNQAPAYDAGKLQTFVNACQTAANTFHANASVATGTSCYMDYVTGAMIGVSGRYTPATQQTILSPSTPTAGVGTPTLPWNTAHVVSLRTANPRGRASNGRCYWPTTAVAVAPTTGRLAAATVNNKIGAFKTFADALNVAAAAYATGMRLIVASAVGGGAHAVVTHIRADDRLDSIERRENDQLSVWTTANLA